MMRCSSHEDEGDIALNFLPYFLWAVQNDSERTVSQEEQKILAMLLREHLWARGAGASNAAGRASASTAA
jgi:hypothetical protein